jgi:hypothetical protein
MNVDRVVYSWPKNRDEEVRATIGEFKGRRVVGIRVWVADANDVDHPTKKGITLSVSALPHLRAAIEALEQAAASDVGESGQEAAA